MAQYEQKKTNIYDRLDIRVCIEYLTFDILLHAKSK